MIRRKCRIRAFSSRRSERFWRGCARETIIALGFVVARFGLFLNLLAVSGEISKNGAAAHGISGVLGIILVLAGTAIILGALLNHRHYASSLPLEDLPKLSLPWLSSFLFLSVATVGVLLVVYLLFT